MSRFQRKKSLHKKTFSLSDSSSEESEESSSSEKIKKKIKINGSYSSNSGEFYSNNINHNPNELTKCYIFVLIKQWIQ